MKVIKEFQNFNDIMTIVTSDIKRKFKEELLRDYIVDDVLNDSQLSSLINNYRKYDKFEKNDELLNNLVKIDNNLIRNKSEKVVIDGINYYKYPTKNKKGYKLIKKY